MADTPSHRPSTREPFNNLREPFPPSAIGHLPRAGIQLDYVGHAAVTDRLLAVDPLWTWEPFSVDEHGQPYYTVGTRDAVMWIRLTVCGVTRPGVGIVAKNAFELEKQLISDALRNAAMRFGVALDLWAKEDLNAQELPKSRRPPAGRAPADGASGGGPVSRPTDPPPEHVSGIALHDQQAKVKALQAHGVSVADERKKRHLPLLDDKVTEDEFGRWKQMLAELDRQVTEQERPFTERAS